FNENYTKKFKLPELKLNDVKTSNNDESIIKLIEENKNENENVKDDYIDQLQQNNVINNEEAEILNNLINEDIENETKEEEKLGIIDEVETPNVEDININDDEYKL